MKQAVSDSVFMLLGILVGIAIIMLIGMLGSKAHEIGNDRIDREVTIEMLNKAADAYPYADISRLITGDDIVEFITDNGAFYNYYIKFKDGTIKDLTLGSDEYNKAKEAVKNNLKDMPEGDAEIYANTALWSQYYLSREIFGDNISSKYKPVIYVNRTGESDSFKNNNYSYINGGNSKGWTEYKDESNQIQYTFLDIIDSEEEFVIVYVEQ